MPNRIHCAHILVKTEKEANSALERFPDNRSIDRKGKTMAQAHRFRCRVVLTSIHKTVICAQAIYTIISLIIVSFSGNHGKVTDIGVSLSTS